MYGVVWITPPNSPANTDDTPSVSRTVRVSYSSPAAAALSVQSMPPTMVARANGSATGIFCSAASSTPPHQSHSTVVNGDSDGSDQAPAPVACSAAGTSGTPSLSLSSRPPTTRMMPMTTAASAPGTLYGSARCATNV